MTTTETETTAARTEPCTLCGAGSDQDCFGGIHDAHELGRAAWRRAAEPFAIMDRALDPLVDNRQVPPGDPRNAVYLAWFEGYDAAKAAGEPQAEEEKPRPKLTITHTSADGTLLEGSS